MAKILIIDSDAISCKILQRALRCHDHEVAIARRGGNQGLVMAVTEKPDLVMLGLTAPADPQVVSLLRTSTITQDIPVLALLVNPTPQDLEAVRAMGCSGYGVKPLELGRLLRQVRRLTRTTAAPLRLLPTPQTPAAAETVS